MLRSQADTDCNQNAAQMETSARHSPSPQHLHMRNHWWLRTWRRANRWRERRRGWCCCRCIHKNRCQAQGKNGVTAISAAEKRRQRSYRWVLPQDCEDAVAAPCGGCQRSGSACCTHADCALGCWLSIWRCREVRAERGFPATRRLQSAHLLKGTSQAAKISWLRADIDHRFSTMRITATTDNLF